MSVNAVGPDDIPVEAWKRLLLSLSLLLYYYLFGIGVELTGLLLTPTLYFHISAFKFIFLSVHLSPTVVKKKKNNSQPHEDPVASHLPFFCWGGGHPGLYIFLLQVSTGMSLALLTASSVILKGRMQNLCS